MAAQEQKKSYAVIKNFKGINTKANRTAIDDSEFSWIENAMPIGSGNIKTLLKQSQVLTSGNAAVTFANTVVALKSVNIGLNDYILASEANGRMEYFDVTTSAKGNVAASGTFSSTGVKTAQYKNERVMIADPSKGLFSWDGNNVIAIGSVGSIYLQNHGSGYTEAPIVTLSAPNDANGIQATAVATITPGAGGVYACQVTSGGSGYSFAPEVNFSSPDLADGVKPVATASVSGGKVDSIVILSQGSGYLTAPTITFSSGAAAATALLISGRLQTVSLTNAGSGYTAPPSVTFQGGYGANATAIAQLTTFRTGTVSILVNTGGTGYTNAANTVVTITGGGGSNAAATAIIDGGQISAIVMTNPGTGYTSNPTVTVTGGGATTSAIATAFATTDTLTDVATFGGRVWVASGRNVFYSAAGSYSDFTSVSAGSVNLTDETLHGNIQALLSANNFLYVFGEDSINVFSDVRVSSSGATLFTNTNISASVGTKRGNTIFPYFRSVLFMNDYGMYALVGSTTSKLSDTLDGIFPLIDFSQPVSAGQVLLNNILCAAFSFTYTDAVLGSRQIQAVFFEKKWFLSSQGSLSYVTSVPANGAISLYGTISDSLYKLYAISTSNVSVKIQTALMPLGDAIRTKQALKFGIEATLSGAATMNVTVDSERASSPAYVLQNSINWISG
jgi:hypothetical protein